MFLKIKNTLWPHIEKEVEDAEIGQETMLLLVDLIVGARLEVGIFRRMLGVDGGAEVGNGASFKRFKMVGAGDTGLNVK